MDAALERLQRALSYTFRDAALLEQALTHRSRGARNNERLEFLGDGVLNLAVAELLYAEKPDAGEGDLSRLRASLVCEDSLAQIAAALPLSDALRLGPGELKSGGYRRDSILADALEALIGAIHLDGGAGAAREVCHRLLAQRLAGLPDPETLKDAKTRLQEWLQARARALPEYDLVSQEGPAHQQTFVASCRAGDLCTQASGNSRRHAEQGAAESMLKKLLELEHA